jgi:hypothetical protein
MVPVKVYTVNGAAAGSASALLDWLVRKRAAKAKGKRAIREHVEGTIELIQHFEFPEASNRIKSTRDGHHVIATGTYKPQMRVWDLDQLALKFERHADIENVDFTVSFLCAPTPRPIVVFSLSSSIKNAIHRSFQTIGQRRFIYRPTAPSNYTRRAVSITAREYRALAVHSLTIFPAVMHSLGRRATKCTVSIWNRVVS